MKELYQASILADDGREYLLCYYLLRQDRFYGVLVKKSYRGNVVEQAEITYLGEAYDHTLGLIYKLGRNTVTPCVLAQLADEWLEESL